VGRAVAAELRRHPGTRVRVVSRSGHAVEGAEALACDLSDPSQAARACAGAATVTFAAAPAYTRWTQDFPALQEAAIRGAAAAGAVLVSAENLYGYGRTGVLREDDPLAETTRKGRVRAEMTERLLAAHAAGEVRATMVRASDLFGPGMAVSALGERVWPPLIAGKTVGWIGDPDAPHTFTYLADFARALVRAGAEPAAWGRAWHAPSPSDRTPREIVSHAARLMGRPKPTIRPMPRFALKGLALVSPVLREVAEMAYQFEAPFHMDASAWPAAFGDAPTPWDDALRATLAAWGGTMERASHAAA
jgi:nucleoside-diphosphate-sugar epimerase